MIFQLAIHSHLFFYVVSDNKIRIIFHNFHSFFFFLVILVHYFHFFFLKLNFHCILFSLKHSSKEKKEKKMTLHIYYIFIYNLFESSFFAGYFS